MQLYLNSEVAYLLRLLLQVIPNSKLFIPNFNAIENKDFFQGLLRQCLVTGIAATETKTTKFLREDTDQRDKIHLTLDPRLELFRVENKFHYSFYFPDLNITLNKVDENTEEQILSTVPVPDQMLLWDCSKSSKLGRLAPRHIIAAESMLRATLPGGFVCAVLPKKWLSSKLGASMQFMKWFSKNAALVAKIKLPHDTVTAVHDNTSVHNNNQLDNLQFENDGETLLDAVYNVNQDWSLYIWCKSLDTPLTEGNTNVNMLKHAVFRWPSFVYRLNSLSESDTEACARTFRHHDWFQNNISFFNEMVKEFAFHRDYGCDNQWPVELPDPEKIRILQPGESAKLKILSVKKLDDLQSITNAVHIKPGPPIKVTTYSEAASLILLDIVSDAGVSEQYVNGVHERTERFSHDLKTIPFNDLKEDLIRNCLERGLQPCILEADLAKIKKQVNWLERQLTPIERTVKISLVKSDSIRSLISVPENEINKPDTVQDIWETYYEDIGMQATQAEVMQQWHDRIFKMKMDKLGGGKLTFDFQLGDLKVICSKSGVLNSNKMGLGKTLESLLSSLLRTSQKVLIICPTKLIGEWQEEIEKTLTIYARRARLNWRGKPIKTDYQVIEWAKQCLPENLKTFNIVSYERLSTVPKDALFHKCPKCKTITCSPKGIFRQECPNPDCDYVSKWREECKTNKLRKHLVSELDDTKIHGRFWKFDKELGVDKIDLVKLSLHCELLKSKGVPVNDAHTYQLVDPRPVKPTRQIMLPQDKRFKKVQHIKTGGFSYKNITDKVTGKSTPIRVPDYSPRIKTLHLRWTFAHLLRYSSNDIKVDEALYIKNANANRSVALWHICGRTRMTLTGTPIRGYPQNIINIINWTVDRRVYPDYRSKGSTPNINKFLKDQGTYVTIENPQTGATKKKLLPKIKDAERFQAEIAPIMLRHTSNEPLVVKDVLNRKPIQTFENLEMDAQHRKFYALWLEKFAEWWAEKRREEDDQEGARQVNDILAKLGYLINASTQPHHMFQKLSGEGAAWALIIGHYKGPLTAKQKRTFELVKEAKRKGDKSLVFSIRRSNLELGQKWCDKQNIHSLVVHGGVSNAIKKGSNRSKRQEVINDFRHKDYHNMWCGLTALSEGANIPEANRGIFMDYSWEPSEMKQATARMLRPQQTKDVLIWSMAHKGTIDDYMYALNFLKANSADEGVDYMEFDLTTEMIPDIRQYADSIVDGTGDTLKSRMFLAVDILKKKIENDEIE